MQPNVTNYPLDHQISLKLLKMPPESTLLSKGLNGIGCAMFLDALSSVVPMACNTSNPDIQTNLSTQTTLTTDTTQTTPTT